MSKTNLVLKQNPFIKEKQDSILKKMSKWTTDGWENILTGLGIAGKDKRMSAIPIPTFLTQQDVEDLYRADDMAARIVDRPIEEMTREGFELNIEGESQTDESIEEAIEEEMKRLLLEDRVETLMKWKRIYGGAALIIGINGQDPSMPLDLNAIPKIDYIVTIDRYRLIPSTVLVQDFSSKYFGKPISYSLVNPEIQGTQFSFQNNIHYTRIIRADGVALPWRAAQQNQSWGDSIFVRLMNPLRNFQTGHDSIATILQDVSQLIFKMKDLRDMLTQGKDDLIMKRFALASRLSSIVNAIVVQEGEDVERKSTPVAGISDLIKLLNARLVAATDLPHTVLLGESAGGLGATGESELTNWYDHLKNKQESELRPLWTELVNLICSQKLGPTKGIVPKYDLKFCPLWQMSEKDTVANRKTQAETDQIYIQNQVVDPEEIAKSRFGDTGYSIETTIDFSLREALSAKQDPSQLTDPVMNQNSQGEESFQGNKNVQNL